MDVFSGNILYILVVGAIAGLIASWVFKKGFSVIVYIALGVVGSLVGRWGISVLKSTFGNSIIDDIITAALGAIFLIFISRFFKK